MHHYHSYILLIPGVLLLLLGRKLFWLSVAAIGFAVGAELASAIFPHRSELIVLAVEIATGLIGALLAIFVQELAIGLAGFFLGGELCVMLSRSLNYFPGHSVWLFFIVGGIIGAILMVSFFDWALIILSSLAGAHLIMDALKLALAVKMAGFLALAIVGIFFQAAISGKKRAAAE